MLDPTLTLIPIKCRHPGCESMSASFGFCSTHEAEAVRRRFEAVVQAGIARHDAPRCFNNHSEWQQYVVAFDIANKGNRGGRFEVEFCRDCTPGHRQDALAAGRCEHPETVFIRSERYNDVIGVAMFDRRKPEAWEKAMMGVSGPVVAMPPSAVVGSVMQDVAGAKRGRGRPRKVGGLL